MTQLEWNRRSEWPLTAAALIFLAAYSVQVITNTESLLVEILIWVTWAVFVLDYVVNLALAPQRGRWFVRNLHELAIVALPALRPLRLLRLVTLLRAMHRVGGNALRGRVLTYVLGAAALLIYVGALAVLDVEENAVGSNLTTFGDAIWCALTTITTVGYGDHYPVTVLGRCVAAGLMIGGVAVLGVVTASVASWMVQTVADETQAEIDAAEAPVHLELQKLSEQVQHLTTLLEAARDGRQGQMRED
ncbi:potassium channel family protein [Pseudarthrobacter sp. AB1]|uniref:potassium channel family protein n=1 Tax=Pseudarthrobacter sp. AB1 TaxID=2138309 RepID=UPI00186B684E|nr:potassium channel family protein [Pseudarthrobacter sp. AB1]MBE4719553.1 voltage-gated potassium channel [Pseudarthrobacter sp. AB1]